MTPKRVFCCSRPSLFGGVNRTTSPLGTKTLHEGGNLQHLLPILLVGRDHLRFVSNNFHAPELVGSDSESLTNCFRTRETRCFEGTQRSLRLRIQTNRDKQRGTVFHPKSVSHIVLHLPPVQIQVAAHWMLALVARRFLNNLVILVDSKIS